MENLQTCVSCKLIPFKRNSLSSKWQLCDTFKFLHPARHSERHELYFQRTLSPLFKYFFLHSPKHSHTLPNRYNCYYWVIAGQSKKPFWKFWIKNMIGNLHGTKNFLVTTAGKKNICLTIPSPLKENISKANNNNSYQNHNWNLLVLY